MDFNLRSAKVAVIKSALEHHNGNKTRAAKALGMNLRTLRNYVTREPELAAYRSGGAKFNTAKGP
jgi:transcriptional regulator with PAS, ATPase and Fis domain